MRIMVSLLAYDDGKSGIADYINSVCLELSKHHQLTLWIHQSDWKIFPVKNSNITPRIVSEWIKRPLISMFWHLYALPIILKYNPYDLIFLPAGNRRLLARFPQKTVVTFHDLSQFHIQNKYDRFRMFYIRYVIPHYLKKAPHIMAISENTKNDLIKHYHLAPHRIQVNYNGFSMEKLLDTITVEEMRRHYGITKPYLLYISRIEHPGKNHLQLIRAFEILPEHIRDGYDLVLAGSDWSGAQVVHDYAERSLCRDSIRFLGFVENRYLGALYKGASLYAFPSLYEGFGIPLLEAMAMGTPVICANRSSLPEIGGDAVLTFNPYMHADVAKKILCVLNDSDIRDKMITSGLERIKQFNWENHVDRMLDLVAEK